MYSSLFDSFGVGISCPDTSQGEHHLLHVNYWSLKTDHEQECQGGRDGKDAEELLGEEHVTEPHWIFDPAVDEVDDGPV